jgi:hypothetical protein
MLCKIHILTFVYQQHKEKLDGNSLEEWIVLKSCLCLGYLDAKIKLVKR